MNIKNDIKKRIVGKIEIKNNFVVKGRKMEGVRKISLIPEIIDKHINAGIQEFCVHDVVASLYNTQIDLATLNLTFSKIFYPITVGGGIHTIEHAHNLFQIGAEKLCINTGFARNSDLINSIAKIYGSQAISFALDVRFISENFYCFFETARETYEESIEDLIRKIQDSGIGEIILTSIDRDGTNKGADTRILEHVLQQTNVPVLYSGGIQSIEDGKAINSQYSELSGVCVNSAIINNL